MNYLNNDTIKAVITIVVLFLVGISLILQGEVPEFLQGIAFSVLGWWGVTKVDKITNGKRN